MKQNVGVEFDLDRRLEKFKRLEPTPQKPWLEAFNIHFHKIEALDFMLLTEAVEGGDPRAFPLGQTTRSGVLIVAGNYPSRSLPVTESQLMRMNIAGAIERYVSR